MDVILTLLIVFLLLCLNEFWWRYNKHRNEFSRKSIHIVIGVFTAVWPLYLSFPTIRLLALGYLVVVSLSKYFNVFKSIHSVKRSTWGEIGFALAVGVLSLVTTSKWLFMICILQMALADGLAAIIGTQIKSYRYKVFGQYKSLLGTGIFFIVSLIILVIFKLAGHLDNPVPYLGLVSLIACALENLGARGLDNLLVPVAVFYLLH